MVLNINKNQVGLWTTDIAWMAMGDRVTKEFSGRKEGLYELLNF